ncbi:MAG: divalent-cation tolerance protein CutA [Planctomycetaceae bacterium]
MTAAIVYVTASNKDEALRIGRALVEERLAACVNVIDGMTSVYHWEGNIEESAEALMIAKTQPELVETLIERVKSLHSYSCPCVVSWPIETGNPAYLDWIRDETSRS